MNVVASDRLATVDDLKVIRHVSCVEDDDHINEEKDVYGPVSNDKTERLHFEAQLQRDHEAAVNEDDSDEDIPSILMSLFRIDDS